MSADDIETHSESSDTEAGLLDRILLIETQQLDRLFALSLLLYFGVLLALTPQYRPGTRLFPLVIGVPTFLLLCVLLLTQSSSRMAAFAERFSTSEVLAVDEPGSGEGESDEIDVDGDSLLARRKRVITISLWILGLFAAVLVIGFLPAMLLFLLAFYRLYAEEGWIRSILYTAIMWVITYLIFVSFMGIQFYQGYLRAGAPV